MYKKPVIAVMISKSELNNLKYPLKEVLAGIEEEGVLFQVYESAASDSLSLAQLGMETSQLGAGIGIDSENISICVRNMPPNKPLFQTAIYDKDLRKVGANAARYVKGIPFKV